MVSFDDVLVIVGSIWSYIYSKISVESADCSHLFTYLAIDVTAELEGMMPSIDPNNFRISD